MTKREAVESWLEWLKNSISETIKITTNEEVDSMGDDEIDVNFIVHELQESIEYDLGKFKRGLEREVLKAVLKGE
jgi:hypothetical protein